MRQVMDELPVALAMDAVPPELAERARQVAAGLAGGTNLLHGDLHPGNVLMGPTGPQVIDWEGAAAGPPTADHALTLVLLRHGSPDPSVSAPVRVLIALVRRLYASFYQRAFAQLTSADPATVSQWVYVLTVARLADGIAEERDVLLEAARGWRPES